MDPKIQAFRKPPPKPPRLTFSELNIKTTDPKWIEAFRCVKMYHQQALDLSKEEARDLITIIVEGHYKITDSARTSPASHKIYRIPEDRQTHIFDSGKIEWVHYLILKAIYPTQEIPDTYMNAVKEKFINGNISDVSKDYYQIYPDIGEEMRKLESIVENGHELENDNQGTSAMNKYQRQKLIDQMTREDLINMVSGDEVTKNDVTLVLTGMEIRCVATRNFESSKRSVGIAPPKPSIEKAEQAPAKASLATPVSSAKKLEPATKKRNQDDFLDQTATGLSVEENTQSSPPTRVEDIMNSTPSRSTYVDSTLSNMQRAKRLKNSEKETSDVGHEKETEESLMQLATRSEANQRVMLQTLEALGQKIKGMDQRMEAMDQRMEAMETREKKNTGEQQEITLQITKEIGEIKATLLE